MTERDRETSGSAHLQTRAHPRKAAVVIVLAALVVAGVGLFLSSQSSGDRSPDRSAEAASADSSSAEVVALGTPSSGSCLEHYDLTTLAKREQALDGVVRAVEGDTITLSVKHWFKGGSGAEITLAGASTLASITSAGQPVKLHPGTRLLVSGDGGFAWSCGFTRTYRSETAAEWARTLEQESHTVPTTP